MGKKFRNCLKAPYRTGAQESKRVSVRRFNLNTRGILKKDTRDYQEISANAHPRATLTF